VGRGALCSTPASSEVGRATSVQSSSEPSRRSPETLNFPTSPAVEGNSARAHGVEGRSSSRPRAERSKGWPEWLVVFTGSHRRRRVQKPELFFRERVRVGVNSPSSRGVSVQITIRGVVVESVESSSTSGVRIPLETPCCFYLILEIGSIYKLPMSYMIFG